MRHGAQARRFPWQVLGRVPSALARWRNIIDLYWYGIHGVELLSRSWAPDKSVRRVHTPDFDQVIGVWDDGGSGPFRGTARKT